MNFALGSLANSTVNQATTSTGTPAAVNSSADPRHRKLVDAAQQFEGMLLEELLKPMRERSFGSGDSDNAGDDSGSSGSADTLASFGAESLTTAISRSGGLGIAKLVIEQVEHEKSALSPARARP